ncbi:MAG TPA: FAD:protein FMN transferase [Planctomycetaceae bacterium]|nr:FAD:protein FMN transferase [Planctomycetaceae bacterium]
MNERLRITCRISGLIPALLVAAGVAAAPPDGTAPARDIQRFEFAQMRMGVPFRITLYSSDEAVANNAARAAFARVKELNLLLSDYEPDSELMQLCRRSAPARPVEVSPELFFVLERAVALSKASDGAFDVTVGPIVQLWREARHSRTLPDPEQLAAARSRVGWRSVRLDRERRTVELLKPDMRLDLGGIAKGYAADEALRVLNEHGVTRALIAAAGDIVAGDPPPDRDGWRIGIAPLDSPEGPPSRYLRLENAAVSTSGDAFQYVEIEGVRYSHIVDPRTGLGLTTRSSVTVVARDGITADSLASAASVLGPDRGLKLAGSYQGTAALFIVLEGDEQRTRASASLKPYLEQP